MRAPITAAVAAAVAVLLTGCGGGEPAKKVTERTEAATPPARILSDAELNKALLDADSVGTGFRSQTYGWDVNDRGPGCLDVFDSINWFATPAREAKGAITADTEYRSPSIFTDAATFGSVKDAATAVPALRQKIGSCTRVDAPLSGGRVQLRLTHDEKATSDAVDEQFNVSALGVIRNEGVAVPLSARFSVARVGNNVVLTAFLTYSRESVDGQAASVTEAAVARMVAVAAGKPVPDVPPLGFEPDDPKGSGGTDV